MTISSLAFQWAVRAFGRDHVGAFGTELEWGLERELDRELDRVRWQSLLEHFTKRNQEKLDLGLHPNA
jgi:hypothetical protein